MSSIRNRNQYSPQTQREFEYINRQVKKAQNPLALVPIGARVIWNGVSVPAGWLDCDGAAISREKYSELFKAIRTIEGEGDGSTTFNIPSVSEEIIYTGVVD